MALAGKPAIHRISYVYILRKLYQTGLVRSQQIHLYIYVLSSNKVGLIMLKRIVRKPMQFTWSNNGRYNF